MLRAICTGQSWLRKDECVAELVETAKRAGKNILDFHVGDLMYKADPSIATGRILNIDLHRLGTLRKLVFGRDIMPKLEEGVADAAVVCTHATFRWKRGLFEAFDKETIQGFAPNMLFTIVEDVDAVALRLKKDKVNAEPRFTLKDLLVWREEEIMATRLMAWSSPHEAPFYIIPRPDAPKLMRQLLFERWRPKAYISFPITHVADDAPVKAEIEKFKAEMKELLAAFDPYTIAEKRLENELVLAVRDGEGDPVRITSMGEEQEFPADEIMEAVRDINGQIVSRDFWLIDQSDMLIALVPEINGKPMLSSGVIRELGHAHERTKDTYAIWLSSEDPSPFLKDVISDSKHIFGSLEQASEHFQKYVAEVECNA